MNLNELCIKVRDWTNREDLTDAQITGFVRLGETRLSQELRIKDMIQIDTATIKDRRVLVPTDWLEADFIRSLKFGPLRYISRDDFYAIGEEKMGRKYTLSGNYIIFGGKIPEVEGLMVELHYYGNVPEIKATTTTWLSRLYPNLQLTSALVFAYTFLLEQEKAAGAAQMLLEDIQSLNNAHLKSKASGSLLNRRQQRSYG